MESQSIHAGHIEQQLRKPESMEEEGTMNCWFAMELSIMSSINRAHTLVRVNSTMMKMGVHMLCILHVNIRVLHHV